MSKILHPWSVSPMSVNHSYQVVIKDGAQARIVAQRLRKVDAERIVRCVNEHADVMARACHAEDRVRELEKTIAKLRAYIRDNEIRTLRGIPLIQQEAI